MAAVLFQQSGQIFSFGRRKDFRSLFKIAGMFVEGLPDDFGPHVCQVNVETTVIRRILDPGRKSFIFQSIYSRRHGPAGQKDLLADGIDRQRAFVKQYFHDCKLTEQKSRSVYAVALDFLDGLVGLPRRRPHPQEG